MVLKFHQAMGNRVDLTIGTGVGTSVNRVLGAVTWQALKNEERSTKSHEATKRGAPGSSHFVCFRWIVSPSLRVHPILATC